MPLSREGKNTQKHTKIHKNTQEYTRKRDSFMKIHRIVSLFEERQSENK